MYDLYFKTFTSIFFNMGSTPNKLAVELLTSLFKTGSILQTRLVRQYGVNCDKVIFIIYSYAK